MGCLHREQVEDMVRRNTDPLRGSCAQEMHCGRLSARGRLPASLPWTTVLRSMYHKRMNYSLQGVIGPEGAWGPQRAPAPQPPSSPLIREKYKPSGLSSEHVLGKTDPMHFSHTHASPDTLSTVPNFEEVKAYSCQSGRET